MTLNAYENTVVQVDLLGYTGLLHEARRRSANLTSSQARGRAAG